MRRMKAILGSLRGLAAIAALTTGLTASAQSSIQFFTLQKVQGFTQTGTATVAANNDAAHDSYPWRFEANINGTALDPTHPAGTSHVTTPGGSVTGFNLGFLAPYGWEYRPGYSSQAAMDADLINGTYSVLLGTTPASSFNLNLAGDFYPNNPLATLTGGSWAGGVYQLDPANAWTLNSGTFTFNVGAANSRIEIAIMGTGVNFNMNAGFGTAHPFTGSTGTLDLTSADVGAPSFLAGNNYSVDIRFLSGTDYQDIGAAVGQTAGSAFGAALYDSQLSFTIQAIPEPSTYALFAGGLGLMLAIWRRLRLTAAD